MRHQCIMHNAFVQSNEQKIQIYSLLCIKKQKQEKMQMYKHVVVFTHKV